MVLINIYVCRRYGVKVILKGCMDLLIKWDENCSLRWVVYTDVFALFMERKPKAIDKDCTDIFALLKEHKAILIEWTDAW